VKLNIREEEKGEGFMVCHLSTYLIKSLDLQFINVLYLLYIFKEFLYSEV
jgi:hypothetical protein